jgi:hypothetical protein
MHVLPDIKQSRSSRDEVAAVDGLVVAGLAEPALGALTGWPMAIAVSRPQHLGKLGIRSGARMRRWHLDLIMLGGLTAAAPSRRLVHLDSWGFVVGLAGVAWKRWMKRR